MSETQYAYIEENGDLRVFYYYAEEVIIPKSVMMKYREETRLKRRRDEITKKQDELWGVRSW